MSDNDNLPVLLSRFDKALQTDNPRKRASLVNQVFADLDRGIDSARSEYANTVGKASRQRSAAEDAQARERKSRIAIEDAIKRRDTDTAVRQKLMRDEHANQALHCLGLAREYDNLARLQQERQEDLRSFREDLRRRYEVLEHRAITTEIDRRYLSRLDTYKRLTQELDAAEEQIRSIEADTAASWAYAKTDPDIGDALLGRAAQRRAAADEIDRMMGRPQE